MVAATGGVPAPLPAAGAPPAPPEVAAGAATEDAGHTLSAEERPGEDPLRRWDVEGLVRMGAGDNGGSCCCRRGVAKGPPAAAVPALTAALLAAVAAWSPASIGTGGPVPRLPPPPEELRPVAPPRPPGRRPAKSASAKPVSQAWAPARHPYLVWYARRMPAQRRYSLTSAEVSTACIVWPPPPLPERLLDPCVAQGPRRSPPASSPNDPA